MIHSRNNKKMTAIKKKQSKNSRTQKRTKNIKKISNAFFKNSDQDSRWPYPLFVLS